VFYENELPDYWGWYNYNGGDTHFKAMVIDATDDNTLSKYGIQDPKGHIPLCDSYGSNVSILYLEIEKTKGNTIILDQDCGHYTAWNRGNFVTGIKGYFCVVDATGDISIDISNRFAALNSGKGVDQKGKGWYHVTSHRRGFGGCIQVHVYGTGTIKIALALPYAYVGYIPEEIHAWAGYVGTKDTAYTHNDVIVG
jgi:hypothetical protein